MAALVPLDLCTAFDVTDQRSLKILLEYSYGVTGNALSWIKSYLSDRLQHVIKGKSTSEGKCLDIGELQGSVLEPHKYHLLYYCYTDDIQDYIAILPKENWLDISNQEKTELIIFNPKHKSRKMTEEYQLQVSEKKVCVV